MSEVITKEEARDLFLEQVRVIAHYWITNERAESSKEKVEGAIFSVMNIFDGTCGGFPAAIDLVLRPHSDDKKYCIDNDENWIEDGQLINDDCHLHEMVFRN